MSKILVADSSKFGTVSPDYFVDPGEFERIITDRGIPKDYIRVIEKRDITLELIGRKTYEELNVQEVCDRVEVSRVTFFKYFPRKKDVLIYSMAIWSLDQAVEQRRNPLQGREAIHRLFGRAAAYQDRPGILLTIIGVIARLSSPPAAREISLAEETAASSLPGMLLRHIEEAIRDGEMCGALRHEGLVGSSSGT